MMILSSLLYSALLRPDTNQIPERLLRQSPELRAIFPRQERVRSTRSHDHVVTFSDGNSRVDFDEQRIEIISFSDGRDCDPTPQTFDEATARNQAKRYAERYFDGSGFHVDTVKSGGRIGPGEFLVRISTTAHDISGPEIQIYLNMADLRITSLHLFPNRNGDVDAPKLITDEMSREWLSDVADFLGSKKIIAQPWSYSWTWGGPKECKDDAYNAYNSKAFLAVGSLPRWNLIASTEFDAIMPDGSSQHLGTCGYLDTGAVYQVGVTMSSALLLGTAATATEKPKSTNRAGLVVVIPPSHPTNAHFSGTEMLATLRQKRKD